jgi:NADP-dependent 3-hydroxy acid dehydrogenase YdfG
MISNVLSGKVAIVSGASSGAGRATALLLASHGAHVGIFSRDADKLQKTILEIQAIDPESFGMGADVSNLQDVRAVFAEADRRFGSVDILVNNAGLPANNILNTDPAYWQTVLNVNVLGYMNCALEAITRMKANGGGHIVNIGSLCVTVRDNGADLYVAAKLAIEGFSDSLRKEIAPDQIKVTLVNPGAIASGMVVETEEEKAHLVEEAKMLLPDDVADAIFYAVSRHPRVDVTEINLRPHYQSRL